MKRLPGRFLDEFHLVVVEGHEGGFVLGWNPDMAWICPAPIPIAQDSARDHARRIGQVVILLLREDAEKAAAPVFRRFHVVEDETACCEVPGQLVESEQPSAAALLSFLMLQKVWPQAAIRLNQDREFMGLPRIEAAEA